MKIEGIEINTEVLAGEFFELMNEDEQPSVLMGMFPFDKMEALKVAIEEKIENDAKDQCEDQFGFRPETNVALKDLKAKFVVKAMHQVSIDMMRYAKDEIKKVLV